MNESHATIIDGKAIAAEIRGIMAREIAGVKGQHGWTPGLAVILVGEDPASHVYVRNKRKACEQVGMHSYEFKLPAETTQDDLIRKIRTLNEDHGIHGILVQLPLPDHIDALAVIDTIDPVKDVDGFHVVNVGKLQVGITDAMVPCTPWGCLMLVRHALGDNLSGKHAVIVGRSNIVGKPVAALLLRENCTVTIAHSRTAGLPHVTREADILIAAVGKAHMVKADWIKPGATVIDVGINRIDTRDGGTKLVGDVDFNEGSRVAGAITPVPGGVGPMTIACLLRNTLHAACLQHGVKPR